MSRPLCKIKTVDDLIKELQLAKKQCGGDAAIIMSKDEEGNEYGDILLIGLENAKDICAGDEYMGHHSEPAVKPDNKNQNVFVIYPNL